MRTPRPAIEIMDQYERLFMGSPAHASTSTYGDVGASGSADELSQRINLHRASRPTSREIIGCCRRHGGSRRRPGRYRMHVQMHGHAAMMIVAY